VLLPLATAVSAGDSPQQQAAVIRAAAASSWQVDSAPLDSGQKQRPSESRVRNAALAAATERYAL